MTSRIGDGWTALFSRSAVILQRFLQDTLENMVRDVANWVKGTAILFTVGAALVLTAMIALVNGLAWGVVELGVPAYAAWLILAVVTGGVGYLLFKRGSRRGISRDRDDRDDERMGLTFRIVKSNARVTPRRMRRRNAASNGHAGGSKKRVRTRRAAKSGSGHVVIHRTDGRIREN